MRVLSFGFTAVVLDYHVACEVNGSFPCGVWVRTLEVGHTFGSDHILRCLNGRQDGSRALRESIRCTLDAQAVHA